MKEVARKVAVEFAWALVHGQFEEAHALLCHSLRSDLSPAQLKEEFLSMGGYDGGTLNQIDEMEGLDEWPGKLPDEIWSSYIAISGKSLRHEGWVSEAVSVVLMQEDNGIFIRSIEWGRP